MFDQNSRYLPFAKELDSYRARWLENSSEQQQAALKYWCESKEAHRQQLTHAFVGSEFIAKLCTHNPEVLIQLIESNELDCTLSQTQIAERIDANVQHSATNSDFDKQLRRLRQRFLLRIVWRDFNRLATLEQTTAEMSHFAAACIQAAMDFHYAQLATQWGLPIGVSSGAPQPMLVLGMGKLGAYELNVSSDIDLVFAYPEAGSTQHLSQSSQRKAFGGKTQSNQEFFLRLGQKIIQSLDSNTGDGFVFRVDMRLRPWGDSGALVANFDAMENYYQTQGREWERYAMIKARVVAVTSASVVGKNLTETIAYRDGEHYRQKLTALLQPFTYRRYLDYSAIEALRAMKQLINREVSRRGLKNDVKLGAGGIREVEFIVQVFQLIRGGRDSRLRDPQLLMVLPILEQENYLPPGVAKTLIDCYRFLRNTEHAIQGFQDKQTQQLPGDEQNQLRLALMMDCENWQTFVDRLQQVRDRVHQQFQAVIADPEQKRAQQESLDQNWQLLWQGRLLDEQALLFLQQQGIKDIEQFYSVVRQLRESHAVIGMQATARERLDQLMPIMLLELLGADNSTETLQRICSILEAVARRSVYIVLLVENPTARTQLITLCAASSWIAQQLAEQPMLLDELLDSRTLYSPPNIDNLRDELRRDMLRLPWDELEAQMEALRYFRLSHALRVAACEVTNILPLMKVSDYLTFIAEVILEHVLQLAWQQMVLRYGKPGRSDTTAGTDSVDDIPFIIVAYGKLGGVELGHGSDLDLVFIHDADINLNTDGPKPIDNATFFARLGQKIIHILNANTLSGQLYEIDMRLRPSGNSGLLVSSLTAFEKYQLHDAWVWEHQALVRARAVAGSERLQNAFAQLRASILSQPRDLDELRAKVVEMREKMRTHLSSEAKKGGKAGAGEFNLKHDSGGIVDIEFMVQYAVLAWAHREPALLSYTDNIRILEGLERANLLETAKARQLIEIYKSYRSVVHRLALQGQEAVVAGDQFQSERQTVTAVWRALFE